MSTTPPGNARNEYYKRRHEERLRNPNRCMRRWIELEEKADESMNEAIRRSADKERPKPPPTLPPT